MKPSKLKKRGALLLADEENEVKSRGGSEKFEFARTSKAACNPTFWTVLLPFCQSLTKKRLE